MGRPNLLQRASGVVEAPRIDRPRAPQRQRVVASRGPSVCRNGRAHRRHPRQAAGRKRIGPRPHLDLRRRRSGRRRHPRSRMNLRVPGLPTPTPLRRYSPGDPLVDGPVLLGAAPGGRLKTPISQIASSPSPSAAISASPSGGGQGGGSWGAIIFDATGITDVTGLSALHAFIAPAFRNLRPSGRLIVFGTPPEDCPQPAAAAAQRALDGFIRSAVKEARLGSTAYLIYVAASAEGRLESTLRFFLSGRSAYVSGQVVRLRPAKPVPTADWTRPLKDRVAVVTGAARGIGAAIAQTLARDGAQVVGVDVPAAGSALAEVANQIGGTAFQVDITAADAPDRLAAYLEQRHGGADVFVHNAGITRDRSLVNLTAENWSSVLAVNLEAPLRINQILLARNG